MSVLAKSGRWLEALNLLDKMRRGTLLVEVGDGGDGNGEKRSSLTLPVPNDITYNAAINGDQKRWLRERWGGRGGVRKIFYFFFTVAT